MEKSIELHTISKVDVMKGRLDIELEPLSTFLLENLGNRLNEDPTHTHYEDLECPDSPVIDQIIEQIQDTFKMVTGIETELESKWVHVHEKNMSTNIHDHTPCDLSAVFYVSVPEGSGDICFHTSHNKYESSRSVFAPEENSFLIFPGFVEHSVARHQTEEKRISLAFNLNIVQE